MADWYIEYVTAVRRCQADIRRAEEDRMIRLQRAANLPSERIGWSDRLLSRVGDALVSWGMRLQARHHRQVMIGDVSFHPKTYPE